MVRKQMLLTPEQNRQLKSLAVASSRSEGALVREAVDLWLSRQQAEQADWKAHWRQAAGMWKDRSDLDQFYAEQRRRRRVRRERMNKLMASRDPE